MIKVLNPGFYTTIQDQGRVGFRNQGVPISGSMDAISAGLANALLQNPKSDAVLEITLVGPKLLFNKKTVIAITGANMSPKINDISVSNNKAIELFVGDVLTFGKLIYGTRSYLAIKNGIDSEIILNSRSQFSTISKSVRLKKNDVLKLNKDSIEFKVKKGLIKNNKQFYDTNCIEITAGPEFNLFSKEESDKLLNQKLTISKNINRMGYQMEENVLSHNFSMITSPVLPGTVQLLPSGKIIILMKDAQTTGGYPRIFQLTDIAIAVLSQKKSGDKIRFKL